MRSIAFLRLISAITVAACARSAPVPPSVAASRAALPDTLASTLVDRRDGTVYPILKVGTQRWISQNMRFATPKSRCYDDRDELCARLGRLYTWDEALDACPAGWRLASDVDWQELEMSAGMSAVDVFRADARGDGVGDRLKKTGDVGFNTQLGGWFDPNTAQFRRADTAAAIWTSTGADAVWAWHRDISDLRSSIWRSTVAKTFLLSARCVEVPTPSRR